MNIWQRYSRKTAIAGILACLAGVALPAVSLAQKATVTRASIREAEKTWKTYPYSDPSPVADHWKIYPYFRFDGFAHTGAPKSWQVIEMENPYLRLEVLPQIGGKIWSAYDKINGRHFIYNNDVVKFRDIASRGPWTSGGIENNFGIIGHTAGVSSPVDFLTRENSDGSVSCFIGTLDLVTRTRWTLEIHLPADKAWFETRAFWHNGTGQDQPYYAWSNLAVKASDSLRFFDPGTAYIGHGGEMHPWPADAARGKDLSVYGQNNFGGSKSYHIVGRYTETFGAYWPEQNYGMIHLSPRTDKPGRKIFLWGLSRSGGIWEDLLTDSGGQYVEIQGGRLFNQNVPQSSATPFRQLGFKPYQTDTWTEFWYPFSKTDGVSFADLNGAWNYLSPEDNDSLYLHFCPVVPVEDTLMLYGSNGEVILKEALHLAPLETREWKIRLGAAGPAGSKRWRLHLGWQQIGWEKGEAPALNRPLVRERADSLSGSAYTHYLTGRDLARMRDYSTAEQYIRLALAKDPELAPALTEMARLQHYMLRYDSAAYYAGKALEYDTYDPDANYQYSLAAEKLGNRYDAADGYEIAALSAPLRSAALTRLSRLYFREKAFNKALDYAEKSLDLQPGNLEALQLKCLTLRLLNMPDSSRVTLEQLLLLDPLNPFGYFELYRDKKAFVSMIRTELAHESYLELAIWYNELGRDNESMEILRLAPRHNMVEWWEAYLHRNGAAARSLLERAEAGSPINVFPFREESLPVLKWAAEAGADWKPRYYLSLLYRSRNRNDSALALAERLQDHPRYAPFYIFRSNLHTTIKGLALVPDLVRAKELEPDNWRCVKYLAEAYLEQGQTSPALAVAAPFYGKHRQDYRMGMLLARILLKDGQYTEAEKILGKIHILPYEGAGEGRMLYRSTKLILALKALEKNNAALALKKVEEALQWPENLGAGAPYLGQTDTKLEERFRASIAHIKAGKKPTQADLDELREAIPGYTK